MFFSYALAGLVPLVPYSYFEREIALPLSVIGSLLGLFVMGFISAGRTGGRPWRTGARMALLGGLAIFAGVAVGLVFKIG